MSAAGPHPSSTFFRAVNERIVELGWPVTGPAELVCECSDRGCTRLLTITREEYEALRADRELRVVIPGHEGGEGMEVVDRPAHFVLVRMRAA